MGFSIERFKAGLRYGIARPHSYEVIITNPAGGNNDEVGLLCEAAELPGRGFSTTNRLVYGTPQKVAYQEIFLDLELTFICSEDMYEKRFFHGWQKSVIDTRNGYVNYLDDYARDMLIRKVSFNNGAQRNDFTAVVKKCWPMTINPIALSYKDTNSYAALVVTFAYYKWLTEEDNNNAGNGSGITERNGGGNSPGPGLPPAPDPNPDISNNNV